MYAGHKFKLKTDSSKGRKHYLKLLTVLASDCPSVTSNPGSHGGFPFLAEHCSPATTSSDTLSAKEGCFAAQGALNPHRKTQPRTVSSFLISTHIWCCHHQSHPKCVLTRLRPRGAGGPRSPSDRNKPQLYSPWRPRAVAEARRPCGPGSRSPPGGSPWSRW